MHVAARRLKGARDRRDVRPVPAPVVDEFDAPNDLTADERNVWLELAPHGFAAGTLTRATSYGFRLLCRNIVLERELAANVEQRGGANHRGLIQRIDAELARFVLAPMGKPLVEQKAPEDEWAQFDVIQGGKA